MAYDVGMKTQFLYGNDNNCPCQDHTCVAVPKPNIIQGYIGR